MNDSLHVRRYGFCTAKLPNSLGSLSNSQVTGAGFAMLCFSICSQTKSLLGGLVRFLFWHFDNELSTSVAWELTDPP